MEISELFKEVLQTSAQESFIGVSRADTIVRWPETCEGLACTRLINTKDDNAMQSSENMASFHIGNTYKSISGRKKVRI